MKNLRGILLLHPHLDLDLDLDLEIYDSERVKILEKIAYFVNTFSSQPGTIED